MAGNFNLNDYVQVNERIELFYKDHPHGSIQTEIVYNQDGQVIIKAYAYRSGEDKIPTTGHAMEKEGSTYINKTSHVENCETSAVGRALAMMGYEIKKSVASREEVENAVKQQEDLDRIQKENDKRSNNAFDSVEVKCADCQNVVVATTKKTVEQILEGSQKYYKKNLCSKCVSTRYRKDHPEVNG